MRALVIDPDRQIIKGVTYQIDAEEQCFTIKKVLGADYVHQHEFDNGDVLYTREEKPAEGSTRAFILTDTGAPIFGKAVIMGFSKRDMASFVNCRFSVKEALERVVFCDAEESNDLYEHSN